MRLLYDFKYTISAIFVMTFFLIGCANSTQTIIYNEQQNKNAFEIHEGILGNTPCKIKYKKGKDICALIELTEPVIVSQAEKPEDWGFFQFPVMGRSEDGTLVVSWSMQEDSYKSYGKAPKRRIGPMVSIDGGKTWSPQDKKNKIRTNGYNVYLKNGDELSVVTPTSKNILSFEKFPKAVTRKNKYSYYELDALPKELQGVFLNKVKNNKSSILQAKLVDPGLLRSAIDGTMPIVWWGKIKQLADNSLVAGVYPACYLEDGNTVNSGVAFYKSLDGGRVWEVIGKIPYIANSNEIKKGEGEFTEPDFEILKDSTFVCVMRSGSVSPMLESFSFDKGITWTKPKSFTPNGVFPRLFLLKNGVLVLISGRPGVQVRFNFDGTGQTWTDPIDMIPFMNPDGTYKPIVSCGYTSYIEFGNDSFYMVYSDFTTKDSLGRTRKSIMCRKITVTPKLNKT